MKVNEGDQIVTVWAEAACGPGWSNPLYWVLVRDSLGRLRVEAVQPSKQTETLRTIHATAAALAAALRSEVVMVKMAAEDEQQQLGVKALTKRWYQP